MQHTIEVYEELSDAYEYALRSYLRINPTPGILIRGKTAIAGSALLFDSLFAKENENKGIVDALSLDLGQDCSRTALSEMATKLRLTMIPSTFLKTKTPFKDYLNWIAESEDYVLNGTKDAAGLLCLSLIDELTLIVLDEDKTLAPTKIAEILFLNISHAYLNCFMRLYGVAFKSYDSAPYFLGVENEFERIRKEILD